MLSISTHTIVSAIPSQLRNMKCSIDNKPPTTQRHLKRNAKKEALLEERYASIERENRLLLEKMSYIMKVSAGIS